MTIKEFVEPLKDLANAYKGRFALDLTDSEEVRTEVAKTWYRYLGNSNLKDFRKAVDDWILTQDKAPTVHELKFKVWGCREEREKHELEGAEPRMTDEEWLASMVERYGEDGQRGIV